MASLMGGDFVEAYVLKNACKERLRRMEAAEEKKKGPAEKKEKKTKASGGSGSSSRGGGLFGLLKNKVHPKAAASSTWPMETSTEEEEATS